MIKYLKILLFGVLVFVGCEDEVEELPYIELKWISWNTSDYVGKYVYGLDFDSYEATGNWSTGLFRACDFIHYHKNENYFKCAFTLADGGINTDTTTVDLSDGTVSNLQYQEL